MAGAMTTNVCARAPACFIGPQVTTTSRRKHAVLPRAVPEVNQAVELARDTANVALVAPEVPFDSSYIGLGMLAATFVGTFFVVPMFKSSFKEEDTWMDIYEELTQQMGGVESVEPEEAANKAAEGSALLMDVRMARKFESIAMQHSANYPLYQPIEKWDIPSTIRRAGFTFFGIYGSERNSNWLPEVLDKVPKDTEVIVACEMGGSLTPKNGADTGFQSQSLKAAYYLKKAGYKNVKHLKGGVSEYSRKVAELIPGEEVVPAGQNIPEPAVAK